MDKQEILNLITEIRNRGSEIDDVEVKSAHQGTPKRIYESLSALSNRVGGGVILFGFALDFTSEV